MCSIFGLLDYKGEMTPLERLQIIRAIGKAAEIRGTDATGIAFVQNGEVKIQKAPRPARRMKYRIPPDTRYIMGHTRMTTQGAAIKNYNNHPFPGKVGGASFALAHNGILYNDFELQRARRLPKTIIETDSYVAVQLIEATGKLSIESLKAMAEALEGTFTITVLDTQNNMYFVKGNNPLTIYLIPKLGCYVYASTKEILGTALDELNLSHLPKSIVPIDQGDILKIDHTGKRTEHHFDDRKLFLRDYCGSFGNWCTPAHTFKPKRDPYLEEVIEFGALMGVPEAEIQMLLDGGYDAFDLEELFYDTDLRAQCIRELTLDLGVC